MRIFFCIVPIVILSVTIALFLIFATDTADIVCAFVLMALQAYAIADMAYMLEQGKRKS